MKSCDDYRREWRPKKKFLDKRMTWDPLLVFAKKY